MSTPTPLYPLRFAPIFQYRLWGGRNLGNLMHTPLPGDDPIGEAWILSDRDDFPSTVNNGALSGRTIKELLQDFRKEICGPIGEQYERFPLLLKFLDAREMLSVQVHPSDQHPELLPPGERGKTEAWVVLEADAQSKIWAGLMPDTKPDDLKALTSKTAAEHLASFTPSVGDGVFIQAGTVHALGGGVIVFEVQQNSDVTFRLFDWDRVDPKTGHSRELHIDQALACINFDQGEIKPVSPVVEESRPERRERLFECEFFNLWRTSSEFPFPIGTPLQPTVLVCIDGEGELDSAGAKYPLKRGDVYLLPATIGPCQANPQGQLTLLQILIPLKA